MTRQEEKQTLRGIMKRLEQQLSPTYRERADRSIAAHLLAMPEYQEAQTVFCFVSTPREINTLPILEDILRSGKQAGGFRGFTTAGSPCASMCLCYFLQIFCCRGRFLFCC